MKKFLMTIVALVCIAATASAQTVYVSTGDGAVAYHKSKSCSYLTNSKDVKSVSTAEAKKMGRHECTRCYGASAAAAAKKSTTTAAKKTTTQARDEKGRFIKKADTEKKAAEKKATTTAKKATTQARDEKGRFIKKADTEKKAVEKKAKTEKKAAEKKAKTEKKAAEKKAKTEKKAVEKSIKDAKKKATPARDEKGRFIKKTDTEKSKKAA